MKFVKGQNQIMEKGVQRGRGKTQTGNIFIPVNFMKIAYRTKIVEHLSQHLSCFMHFSQRITGTVVGIIW